MWFRRYIGWLLAVCIVVPGLAQRSPDQFRFEHITIDRGLSHSDAMCVAQDHSGFVWIGTNKGINRYDGYTLKPYNLPIDTQRVYRATASGRCTSTRLARSGPVSNGPGCSGTTPPTTAS